MTLEMNRPKCCCFTGHRENKLKRSEKEILEDLKQAINQAIDDGYTTFITGMAYGVDIWAGELVLKKRFWNRNIKLIAALPFQIMSYSTMTFQESEIYGEDVLEDTECNVEESVMQRMDIERVRTALKMLAPEERAIIQDFFFTESPIPVKELVEKYAMPKTSIYRKRDDALKKLKKILGNA